MNIQIALDYVGYEDKFDPECLYECVYMKVFNVTLKYLLYDKIDLDDGYIECINNKYYILAYIGNDDSDFDKEKLRRNYEKLDSRFKKYFKIDFDDCLFFEPESISKQKPRITYYNVYLKIELTGIDSKQDMVYIDTISKLLEK